MHMLTERLQQCLRTASSDSHEVQTPRLCVPHVTNISPPIVFIHSYQHMPITAISLLNDGVTIVLLFGNNEFSVWSDVSKSFQLLIIT
jgi:hypothetical protein